MNKRKILFISRTLRGGGAERFISTFVNYMIDNNYDVEILLYEEHTDDYYLSSNVKKYLMPSRGESKLDKIYRNLDMYRMLRDIRPDYIIPFVDTVVICAYLANLFLKSKFIYTVRVSPWHEEIIGTKFKNFMRSIIAKKADAIMIQTEEQGLYFPIKYQQKVFVVPNPVPQKFISLKKETYNDSIASVCMLGRLDKQKNIPLAIKAFRKLSQWYPDIRLNIYGEGIETEYINSLIKEVGLQNICYLKGRTSNVEKVLSESDAFLMTSDFEGLPNSLIEAMAMGLPCISSACQTGPSDLIQDGENGYLFEPNNLDALVRKLKMLLDNPQKGKALGQKAREDILQKLNIEKSKDAFVYMLDKL